MGAQLGEQDAMEQLGGQVVCFERTLHTQLCSGQFQKNFSKVKFLFSNCSGSTQHQYERCLLADPALDVGEGSLWDQQQPHGTGVNHLHPHPATPNHRQDGMYYECYMEYSEF